MNLTEKRTRAFAIVTAQNRRGGVRVTRVEVIQIYHEMAASMVEEPRLRGRVTHFLPFDRLAQRRADIAQKLRAIISRPVLAAENPPTHEMAGAEEAGPGAPQREYWYQKL